MIAHQEMGRMASPSVQDGIGGGYTISIPLVMHFAPPGKAPQQNGGGGGLRETVGDACLRGDKQICLACMDGWMDGWMD